MREKIDIQIKSTCVRYPRAINLIEIWARKILKRLKVRQAMLSVLLVGDKKMRRLNREFLKHDYTTDVLAFSYQSQKEKKAELIGDIVICLDVARRQARVHEKTFNEELSFYLCHGILHLLGHLDKTASQRDAMLKLQEKILTQGKVK